MDQDAHPRADRRRARRPPRVHITERDRELLAFVAEHRLVLGSHVQALLRISAGAACSRLRALSRAGYVSHARRLYAAPGWYQISRRGLEAIGSGLPKPRDVDLRFYRHDVGLAWLWLAARDGAFGPVRQVVSERHMRSHDGRTGREARFGVRLGGLGPGGRERLHYPDLILETESGHRVALELELSSKARSRREGILFGYGADARIDAVMYLVDSPAVGRTIMQSASRLGLGTLVHVHRARVGATDGPAAEGRTAERTPRAQRAPRAERTSTPGLAGDLGR